MSTLAVVEEILREVKRPVSVREIVELSGDRLPTKSKTPDTVVARDLSMDIKRKGEASIFIRTSPGRYTMREFVVAQGQDGHGERKTSEQIHGEGTTPLASAAMSESRAPARPARAATSDGVQSSIQDG